MSAQSQRVNVSMISLKWGDFLSTLPPGALALFAVSAFFPALDAKVHNLDQITTVFGLVLLLVSALLGELLGAFTRIFWERFWLVPHCKPPNALARLKEDNLELYERGVQSSYKYVTFYANFAWATFLLLVSRLHTGDKPSSAVIWLLVIAFVVLLRASHVQWTYFVNYLNNVFPERRRNAGQRPTTGHQGAIHKGSEESEHRERRHT
jgi:hypothetical protein